ncbi:MAG: phosphoribosylformylglycinamidine cyclo-ligase [Saprospiraceae bacterium]|nr:phosphoribosylformylglycinamidine cyclo-ligase [Saprospiraceae bacterium]
MNNDNQLKYDQRGVSASKDEVHAAISKLDKGIYPNAFCKILPDIAAGDLQYCNIMHADTAGTKTSLAYIYWKETGDISVWKGIVEDAIVMNLDDLACVGALNNIILSSTIGRNKHLIPAEVISEIINHAQTFIDRMAQYGIGITLAGGETADVGDIVRTIDVGYTAFCRMKRDDVVNIDIQHGDIIVGFSSFGTATYEQEYNGGTGSNGLTSARHDVFDKKYRDLYPESFNPAVPKDLVYAGSKSLSEGIEIDGENISVGKLVLSPTRTYMPLLRRILATGKAGINGIIHCSGGGQTKIMKFVDKNLHIIKDNVFEIPPLFRLIQSESGLSLTEMYQVFNMGHRLEIYVSDKNRAEEFIRISKEFGIDAQVIGRVESADSKVLSIHAESGVIQYK